MNPEKLRNAILLIEADIKKDCLDRLENYPVDLFAPDVNEVVSGLVARQATLAIQLLASPNAWNQHSAPLFHRAMSDVHITLAYTLQDDTAIRAKEYILYGLGQEKLSIAHYEAYLAGKNDPQFTKLVDSKKDWLNSQRLEFLTEVNTGSPTGKTTYQMAEISGNKDLYNFNFTPFSAAVHSTWQHVARFNLETCSNPLHGGHRVGVIPNLENDWLEVWVAIKNLRKTMLLADSFIGVPETPVLSWDRINLLMAELAEDPSPTDV